MRIYLAAPLFSQSDRVYNRRLRDALERRLPACEVILPQDFRTDAAGRFNDRRHLGTLYRQCTDALRQADLVVARLDGADADSGVAFEVGYARALDKPVVGLRTDFRHLQEKGLNVMLARGCTEVLCRFSFDERLETVAEALARSVEKALAAVETRRIRARRREARP